MKKIVFALIMFFMSFTICFADCSSVEGVTLGKISRTDSENHFTEQLGRIAAKDKYHTGWKIKDDTVFTCIFYENVLTGVMIMRVLPMSERNAKFLVQKFEEVEKESIGDGFVFKANSKDESNSISTISKEYYCEAKPEIKRIVTLGKDTKNKVISIDILSFLEK